MENPGGIAWRIAFSCGVLVLVAGVTLSLAGFAAAVWLGFAG